MKLSRASRLGLGAGISGAVLLAVLADLPFAPATLVQAAQGRVAITSPSPTGIPLTPTATGVPGGGGGGGTTSTQTATPTGVPVAPANTPTPTATTAPSGGGGGGGTTSNGTTTVAPGVTSQAPTTSVDPTTLNGTVANVSNVPVTTTTGATITDGNFAITLPAGFSTSANVNVSITIAAQAVAGLAGNVSASPNGTVVDVVITDAATGQPITTVNTPITITVKPSAADLAMANGDPSKLAAIYFVAPNTPSTFNPLGLPTGSALFVTGFAYSSSTGLASWQTQNLAGVVQAVVANPVSYVQTVNPNTQEWSSFDPNAQQQSFGAKPQFSYLQVVAPQIPVDNRLVVLDPDTGNYSYVNAADVAPSGPPPAHSSGALVRGLVKS